MARGDFPTPAATRPGPDRAGAWVVFSDLDGTLLRHQDYDWSEAREAIALLALRRIPLVLTSSKTRAEIEVWRERLGNNSPFISENGGALYVPEGDPSVRLSGATPVAGYLRVEFGVPYPRLREGLSRISDALGVRLSGFGDLGREAIGRLTGLAGEDLWRCQSREYDEPFVAARPLTDADEASLAEQAAALGLRVTRGGRFHHLIGPNSKGDAARLLISAYASMGAPVTSVGVGDGPNDLELLRAVDRPVIVARPDGIHDHVLRDGLPGASFTRGIGPRGFNEAILEILAASN